MSNTIVNFANFDQAFKEAVNDAKTANIEIDRLTRMALLHYSETGDLRPVNKILFHMWNKVSGRREMVEFISKAGDFKMKDGMTYRSRTVHFQPRRDANKSKAAVVERLSALKPWFYTAKVKVADKVEKTEAEKRAATIKAVVTYAADAGMGVDEFKAFMVEAYTAFVERQTGATSGETGVIRMQIAS